MSSREAILGGSGTGWYTLSCRCAAAVVPACGAVGGYIGGGAVRPFPPGSQQRGLHRSRSGVQ